MSRPPGRRLGLILANGSYRDPDLGDLHSPALDARLLEEVLGHPEIAGFTVTSLVDQPAHAMRNGLVRFTREAVPSDVLLVYLSCHGLLDEWQQLYFAGTDTVRDSPEGASVDAPFLLRTLEKCRARQQILILDSCFSGAFAEGAKGASDVGLAHRFPSQARGRVVLTSSSKAEASFEGARTGDGRRGASTYTAALIEGLRSGLADTDGDGLISPEDAHRFAVGRLRDAGATQTPMHWIYEGQGSIILARAAPKASQRPEYAAPSEPLAPPAAVFAPPSPDPPPAPSPLGELAELLTAGNLREADQLTTRILLDSVRPEEHDPGTAPTRFLLPTKRSELPEVLLREIDRVWTARSRGRHGFGAQLSRYAGPRRGTPVGGAGDFQALCRALGWPADATAPPAPPEHGDPPEGFYPTLAGVPAAGDFEWNVNWQLTVMTVHLRLREADHPR